MDWQYPAGFTDGDGCIGVEWPKGRYLCVRLRWSQKLEVSRVLDEIADFLILKGLRISLRNFSVAIAGHRYPQRELCITNTDDTRQALSAMLPYLINKRERAIQALAALNAVYNLKQRYGNKYRIAKVGTNGQA